MVEKTAALTDDAQLPLSILIVAEVRLLREALAHVVKGDPALSVCGLSSDPSEALAMAIDRQPNIVLIDAAFPNGIGMVGRLRNIASSVQIVVVAIHETEQNIIAWAEAGVVGYIPSSASLADVVTLLREIIAGKQPCSERVAAGMLRRISNPAHWGNPQSDAPPASILTRRELQIVELIAGGLSNKEIGRRLNIGVSTTKSHVHHLLGKLALQRRGQIAQWINHKTRIVALPFVLAGETIADFF